MLETGMLPSAVVDVAVAAVTTELVVEDVVDEDGGSVVVGEVVDVVAELAIVTTTEFSAVVVPPRAGVAETEPMFVTLPELMSDWVTE